MINLKKYFWAIQMAFLISWISRNLLLLRVDLYVDYEKDFT